MPQEYTVKNFNRRQIRLEDMLCIDAKVCNEFVMSYAWYQRTM